MNNDDIIRMPTVYIGFDKREEPYYNVLKLMLQQVLNLLRLL